MLCASRTSLYYNDTLLSEAKNFDLDHFTLLSRRKKPFWKHQNGVAVSSWSKPTKPFEFWMNAPSWSTTKIDNSTKKNDRWKRKIDNCSKCDRKWSKWPTSWRPSKRRHRRRKLNKANAAKVKMENCFRLFCSSYKLSVFTFSFRNWVQILIWSMKITLVLIVSKNNCFYFSSVIFSQTPHLVKFFILKKRWIKLKNLLNKIRNLICLS